jgi:two-component system chemotaxis response regulator CheY
MMREPSGDDTATILVVDDDRDSCALLGAWLRSRGYQVIEAWDGLDGLEQLHARRTRIDVVILDLEMPNMDGAAFRTHQLHYPALRGVPVIVSSGHPQSSEIGREIGAVAVVPKPFSRALMEAALAAALGRP